MAGRVIHVQFDRTEGQRAVSRRGKAALEKQMNDMFGMALDVVYDQLELGNPAMARWFASEYLKNAGHRIGTPMTIKVRTAKELEQASEKVVQAAVAGTISFQDAKEMQEAFARHAVLSGLRTIDDLTNKVHDLETKGNKPKYGLNGHTPTWGRLSEAANDPKGKH